MHRNLETGPSVNADRDPDNILVAVQGLLERVGMREPADVAPTKPVKAVATVGDGSGTSPRASRIGNIFEQCKKDPVLKGLAIVGIASIAFGVPASANAEDNPDEKLARPDVAASQVFFEDFSAETPDGVDTASLSLSPDGDAPSDTSENPASMFFGGGSDKASSGSVISITEVADTITEEKTVAKEKPATKEKTDAKPPLLDGFTEEEIGILNWQPVVEKISGYSSLTAGRKDYLAKIVLSVAWMEVHGKLEGINPVAMAAQSPHETGSGTSELFKESNNAFGIKVHTNACDEGDSVKVMTSEHDKDGNKRRERAEFCAYKTVRDSLEYYPEYIRSRHFYKDAIKGSGSPETYLAGLLGATDGKGNAIDNPDDTAKYATDPGYLKKVMNWIEKYEIETLIALAQEGVDTPPSVVSGASIVKIEDTDSKEDKASKVDAADEAGNKVEKKAEKTQVESNTDTTETMSEEEFRLRQAALARAFYFEENNGAATKYCDGRKNCDNYCARLAASLAGHVRAGDNAKPLYDSLERAGKINTNIKDAKPGDILHFQASYYGHMAMLIDKDTILTNITRNGKPTIERMSLGDAQRTYKKFLGWSGGPDTFSTPKLTQNVIPDDQRAKYSERAAAILRPYTTVASPEESNTQEKKTEAVPERVDGNDATETINETAVSNPVSPDSTTAEAPSEESNVVAQFFGDGTEDKEESAASEGVDSNNPAETGEIDVSDFFSSDSTTAEAPSGESDVLAEFFSGAAEVQAEPSLEPSPEPQEAEVNVEPSPEPSPKPSPKSRKPVDVSMFFGIPSQDELTTTS